MKRLCTLLVLLLLISACQESITVYLDKQSGAVSGIVHPKDVQATVSLYQEVLIAETTSTSDGTFLLEDIPVGTYYLRISAEEYGTVVRKGIAVKEGQTTFLGDLLLSRYPWRPVRSIDPWNGATVDRVDFPVVIRFYEDIVDGTFLEAFSISPEVPNLEIEISYYSGGDRVKISGDFVRGTTYTISLDTVLATHFEQRLEFPLNSSFSIVPFQILAVNLPRSNTQSLEIIFNASVKHDSLLVHLTIVPETPVSFSSDYRYPYRSYTDATSINLYPKPLWQSGTTTSVTVDSDLAEVRGATLGADTTLYFEMDSLAVVNTEPYHGQHFVSHSASIRIRFNTMIDESTIAEAISITPTQMLNFSTDQSRYFLYTVYPDTLMSTTTYTVLVDTTIRDFWGGKDERPVQFLICHPMNVMADKGARRSRGYNLRRPTSSRNPSSLSTATPSCRAFVHRERINGRIG